MKKRIIKKVVYGFVVDSNFKEMQVFSTLPNLFNYVNRCFTPTRKVRKIDDLDTSMEVIKYVVD